MLEKGTKNSTATREDGSFQLNVSSGKAKLAISFVGHEPLEVAVDNKTELPGLLNLKTNIMSNTFNKRRQPLEFYNGRW